MELILAEGLCAAGAGLFLPSRLESQHPLPQDLHLRVKRQLQEAMRALRT